MKLLRLYGAEIVTVKNEFFLDPEALEKISARVREENPTAYFTDQLANPANPRTHFETTGPEIWRDTEGAVDIFVAGVGTGGTISGAGKFLKSKKPGLRVVIAEPAPAALPTEENPYPGEIDGVHKVTEVPPEQLPRNFDITIADEVIALNTADERKTARELVAEEGIFAGRRRCCAGRPPGAARRKYRQGHRCCLAGCGRTILTEPLDRWYDALPTGSV